MKKLLTLLAVLSILAGCATTQIKYEKQPFTVIPKVEAYKLPPDPFTEPPVPIFLKKDATGNYIFCQKEEAELVAFTSKELGKITLRIGYLKEISSELEKLVNIHIQRENLLITIIVDQQTAKEIYRELIVDLQNYSKGQSLEKTGQWAIIIGQLAVILGLAF
jgi:hypothetical protein